MDGHILHLALRAPTRAARFVARTCALWCLFSSVAAAPGAAQAITRSVTLGWTAPGNDGNAGTATSYSLRSSGQALTEANWNAATPVAGVPAPLPAGTAQTVNATGFTPGTTVYFGLKTQDGAGNWSSLSNVISVVMPPVVPFLATVSPSTGVAGANVSLTVNGADFQSPDSLWLQRAGSSRVVATSVVTGTAVQLTGNVTLPSNSNGFWDLVVKNPDGKADTLAAAFFVGAAAPSVASITPATGVNTGSISITSLAGANFVAPTVVQLNRSGQAPIVATSVSTLNSGLITCTFNLSGALAGAWDVYVRNPDGQAATRAGAFSITTPPPPPTSPTVTSISPVSGVQGQTLNGATIQGTNFIAPDSVFLTLGGTRIVASPVNVQASTILSLGLNLGAAPVGIYSVTVKNPDGTSGTLANAFTVQAPSAPAPPPTLTSITPSNGLNSGTVLITGIVGTGFGSPVTVKLDRAGQTSIPAAFVTTGGPALITCSFNLTGVAAGAWDLSVRNPDGQTAVLPAAFTVAQAPPNLASITPASGFQGQVLSGVVISGGRFVAPDSVWLARGGARRVAGSVVVTSSSQIGCSLDLTGLAIGTYDVNVKNADGQVATLAAAFAVSTAPAFRIFSITPATAVAGANVHVSLTGTQMAAPGSVWLSRGGAAAATLSNLAISSGTAAAGDFVLAGVDTGAWTLVMRNGDNRSDSLLNGFRITPAAPLLTSMSPGMGYRGTSVRVALKGSRFLGPVSAYLALGSTVLGTSNLSVVGGTEVDATVDLGGAPSGNYSAVLRNFDGQADTLANAFQVKKPKPSVRKLSQTASYAGLSDMLLGIEGSGFEQGDSLYLVSGGARIWAGATSFDGDTSVTAHFSLLNAPAGDWSLTVDNGEGDVASAAQPLVLVTPPAPSGIAVANPLAYAGDAATALTVTATMAPNSLAPESLWVQRGGERRYAGGLVVDSVTGNWRVRGNVDFTGAAVGTWDVGITDLIGHSGVAGAALVVSRRALSVSQAAESRVLRRGLVAVESAHFDNPGTSAVQVRFAAGAPWLSVSPDSAVVAAGASVQVAVRVDATGRTRGVYAGTISATPTTPDLSAVVLPETLQVVEPRLDLAATSVRGHAYTGDSTSTAAVLALHNSGDAVLHFTVHADSSWTRAAVAADSLLPGQSLADTVRWTAASLVAGTHVGHLAVASDDSTRPVVTLADSLVVEDRQVDASPLLCPASPRAAWSGPQARVSWVGSADLRVAGYRVERRDPSGTFAAVASVPGDSLGWTDLSADTLRSYDYRVDPVDAQGLANEGCTEAHLAGKAVAGFPADVHSYPNPFTDHLHVRVDVPAGGGAVRVRVLDATHRVIATLVDGVVDAGRHVYEWNGMTADGRAAAPGVYLVQYELAGRTVKAEWMARGWSR